MTGRWKDCRKLGLALAAATCTLALDGAVEAQQPESDPTSLGGAPGSAMTRVEGKKEATGHRVRWGLLGPGIACLAVGSAHLPFAVLASAEVDLFGSCPAAYDEGCSLDLFFARMFTAVTTLYLVAGTGLVIGGAVGKRVEEKQPAVVVEPNVGLGSVGMTLRF